MLLAVEELMYQLWDQALNLSISVFMVMFIVLFFAGLMDKIFRVNFFARLVLTLGKTIVQTAIAMLSILCFTVIPYIFMIIIPCVAKFLFRHSRNFVGFVYSKVRNYKPT
ncbi:hypothetical protein IMZ31_22455 (plasmid) [Pontibacillus sp. ALD_SL1]|uniref:hypothetical protein n=1 Tax=Pontibacillus sp. ALD_SL1 TaxID=2777185 RepID=UPI001A969642|nr:hypothetical protein [Pontibacillus sp. ALD_SL1]QST02218.1 hypothetical protein IMZ31_22455 [Pontibacillus sp. ALD_SL1]